MKDEGRKDEGWKGFLEVAPATGSPGAHSSTGHSSLRTHQVLHPSSFILHPSSFILHPSNPSSFILPAFRPVTASDTARRE
ncbi:MAG: hypothetical protein ACXW5U_26290 [Thermoanaerobaculia bacterium]